MVNQEVGTGTLGTAVGVNTAATVADPRQVVFAPDGTIYFTNRGFANIRVGTHADLAVLAQRSGLRVLDSFGLQDGQTVRFAPNWRAGTSVYTLSR